MTEKHWEEIGEMGGCGESNTVNNANRLNNFFGYGASPGVQQVQRSVDTAGT